ncbi:MAG: glutamate 5-kinase [Bacteroidales bacterium]|nr:glutamate 5-kinase [Bacteroidales bacterium]
MSDRKQILNKKRIVIKVGSSSLTHSNGKLNLLRIEKLTGVITYLHNQGKEVVLVSSGAIATGAGKVGVEKKPSDKIKKQALAAIGQAELIKIYEKFFEEYNKTVAQLLLTRDGIENTSRRRNARNTLKELLKMKVIPIVNENDTVSTDEIEFGDNDILSAMVSSLINADLLIILSDIDGVFTGDPQTDKDAKLISKLTIEDEDLKKFIFESESSFGTGGMASKLAAGRHCLENGIDMVIANGNSPSIIYNVLEGKEVGTYFEKSDGK